MCSNIDTIKPILWGSSLGVHQNHGIVLYFAIYEGKPTIITMLHWKTVLKAIVLQLSRRTSKDKCGQEWQKMSITTKVLNISRKSKVVKRKVWLMAPAIRGGNVIVAS